MRHGRDRREAASRGRAGLAYVAVLLVLLLLTSLGLTFLSRVSILRATMEGSMPMAQADYLAETAANHAMWRLLHETGFPADTNRYYMHALAGGRYARARCAAGGSVLWLWY